MVPAKKLWLIALELKVDSQLTKKIDLFMTYIIYPCVGGRLFVENFRSVDAMKGMKIGDANTIGKFVNEFIDPTVYGRQWPSALFLR